MDQDRSENEVPYDLNSCNVILDTSKTLYNEESDRFKQTESKAGITLGFVGVLLGFFLAFIKESKITGEGSGYLIYNFGFRIAILALFSISALKFVNAIKVGVFQQVIVDAVVDLDLARKKPEHVTLAIAATYKDVIEKNEKKIDKKTDSYNEGLKYMLWGFLLFLVYFIVEEVIKYV